jgi:hypothetical protein
MNQIRPALHPGVRNDGREFAGMSSQQNRRRVQKVFLGGIRSVGAGQVHGGLANMLSAYKTGRAGDNRHQTCWLRIADEVVVASTNRRRQGLEPTTDQNMPTSSSILQSLNRQDPGGWKQDPLLGGPLD